MPDISMKINFTGFPGQVSGKCFLARWVLQRAPDTKNVFLQLQKNF